MSEPVAEFVDIMYGLDKVTESDIDLIMQNGHLSSDEVTKIKGNSKYKVDNPNKGSENNSGNK